VARWRKGYRVGLAINKWRVQILLEATLRNNLRQIVHTHVPLSPTHLVLTLCGLTSQKTNQGGLEFSGSDHEEGKKPILVYLVLFRHPLNALMLEAPTAR